MVIHPLTPKLENGELRVSARIELDKPPFDLPEIVWFSFPERQAHLVNERADGFAVALLSLALCRGEDVHVRGSMSSRLAWGIQEYQRVQNLRKPHRYHPIEIDADMYVQSESTGSKAASTFSGGVDSFYTVWSHLPQNERFAGNVLSYAIFVLGLDIGLHDTRSFEECRKSYERLMADWSIELLTASTNVRRFDKPENWISASTMAVIGLGHLLGRGLARYYIPANDSYDDYPKGVVASLADMLLSSESLQVIDHGAQLSKYEKIVVLSDVPETYTQLRVCWNEPQGLTNCCECRKCLNTMTGLALGGALAKYRTFPKPLDRAKLRVSDLSYPARDIFWGYFRAALALKRYDLAFDIGVKLFLNYLAWGPKWLKRQVLTR